MIHENSGDCKKCDSIFDRYPGFNSRLREWFKDLQREVPDAHISCAGRGEDDQMSVLLKGLSRASYGKSAHNYGAAIDVFQLKDGKVLWVQQWFELHIVPHLESWLSWYGQPGSAFFELPHIELKAWRSMLARQELALVEPPKNTASV